MGMLWRDDQDGEDGEGADRAPEEMRHALRMLRRAMVVAAVVAWALMAFANWPA